MCTGDCTQPPPLPGWDALDAEDVRQHVARGGFKAVREAIRETPATAPPGLVEALRTAHAHAVGMTRYWGRHEQGGVHQFYADKFAALLDQYADTGSGQ